MERPPRRCLHFSPVSQDSVCTCYLFALLRSRSNEEESIEPDETMPMEPNETMPIWRHARRGQAALASDVTQIQTIAMAGA